MKDDSTRKAHAPCNGSLRIQGTVTLDDTYTASLDQTASTIFCSISAERGNIVVGSDASNTFAEVPTPKAPLYLRLDTQFHEWWKAKGRPPIPDGYGVKVFKAIQGHPKSPRLWDILINGIITKLGFKPCKHKPCIYYHPNYKGAEAYFLRQVDDFEISCKAQNMEKDIIDLIDSHMTIEVKPLGVIARFNSFGVHQYVTTSN